VLNSFLREVAGSLGLEVRRRSTATSYTEQLRHMLAWNQVDLVLDVGANVGQFARELRRQAAYRGRIVSFEPTTAAHRALCAAAKFDPLWEIGPRAAIGARRGTIEINIAGNSVSSSVLTMLESHEKAAPTSRYKAKETVDIFPLDEIAGRFFEAETRAFLKVDTQGYEAEVLLGAPGILQKAVGVQLEVSLVPLYEGQALMPALFELLGKAGLELWALAPAFADPDSGRLLQFDAAFFRPLER
jgi:FkbM family methyltransferase